MVRQLAFHTVTAGRGKRALLNSLPPRLPPIYPPSGDSPIGGGRGAIILVALRVKQRRVRTRPVLYSLLHRSRSRLDCRMLAHLRRFSNSGQIRAHHPPRIWPDEGGVSLRDQVHRGPGLRAAVEGSMNTLAKGGCGADNVEPER